MKITITINVTDPTAPTAGELNVRTDATPCHCTGGRPCYHCSTAGGDPDDSTIETGSVMYE